MRRSADGSRRRCAAGAGFTLVEMLVTLVLVSLVLLLSAQLLRSAGILFDTAEAAGDGQPSAALERQLRHDLQGARGSDAAMAWRDGGLSLEGLADAGPGGRVLWWRDGRRLLRDLVAADGERLGRRVLSRQTVGFRHRQVGRLMEVEVDLDGGATRPDDTHHWMVARRNGSWSDAW